MAHHGDLRFDQPADQFETALAAFDFHGLGSALFYQAHGVANGFISGDMKAAVGHVGNQESALRSAANGANMVQHFVQCDGQSAVVTKHNHAERVADEEHFHTGFVKQTRSGIVVSRQAGDFLSCLRRTKAGMELAG